MSSTEFNTRRFVTAALRVADAERIDDVRCWPIFASGVRRLVIAEYSRTMGLGSGRMEINRRSRGRNRLHQDVATIGLSDEEPRPGIQRRLLVHDAGRKHDDGNVLCFRSSLQF